MEHDDANAVTKKNVVAFKDHRLAEGRSLKTIKDGDLAALKSLFEWGVANGRVTTNPAKEVKIIPPKRVFTRSKGFTDTEAEAILRHSAGHIKSPQEAEKTASAKRWVIACTVWAASCLLINSFLMSPCCRQPRLPASSNHASSLGPLMAKKVLVAHSWGI